METEFGYARADDGAYIAYTTVGEGPIDVVWQFDWFSHIDAILQSVIGQAFLAGLAAFSRVVLHDRRATGLSSRNVDVPSLERRVADLVAVLDAVHSERPVLAGFSEGGAPNVLFATTDPARVRSLVWLGPTGRSTPAPDYPWGVTPEYAEVERRALAVWGTASYGAAFVEQEAAIEHDVPAQYIREYAMLSRNTCTPDVAEQLSAVWYETDIRPLLPALRVPTLLVTNEADIAKNTGETDFIASLVPDSRVAVLPGSLDEVTGAEPILSTIRDFLGADEPAALNTILSTVLFTDIVDSTSKQAAVGDRAWKQLVLRHHDIVRRALDRYRGVENDTAGDGFYATFDGPARAVRCALDVADRVRELGIDVRAGVHTGECEVIDGKCGGLTVSIGARVAAQAGASEVLVSQTVRDLVAGSGLRFDDAGEHELKGVPDRWHLYRVVT